MAMLRFSVCTLLLLSGITLADGLEIASSQPAAEGAAEPARPAVAEAKAAVPSMPGATVTVPWDQLKTVMERGGAAAPAGPPVPYFFTRVSYKGSVAGDVATIVGTCDVTLLQDSWTAVVLGKAGGLSKVTADGKGCALQTVNGQVIALLRGKGDHTIDVHILRQVWTSEGLSGLWFPLVPAPIINVTMTLPGGGLIVTAGDALQEAVRRVEEKDGKTVFAATCDWGTEATIAWRGAAQASRIYTDTNTLVDVEDGLIRYVARVHAEILQAPVSQMQFALDARAVILKVEAAKGDDTSNLARWSEETRDGKRYVLATFSAPVQGVQRVHLTYEHDVAPAGGEAPLAIVTVVDSKRDRGNIAIQATGEFEVNPGKSNVPRVGVRSTPSTMPALGDREPQHMVFGYAYVRQPVQVSLELARPKPQPAKIFATTNTLITVEAAAVRGRADIRYDILHAAVGSLRIALPKGAELVGVTGEGIRQTTVAPAPGKKADAHEILTVDLKDPAQGSYALTVTYDLHLPKDRPAAGADVPLVWHVEAAQDRGSVGVEVRGGAELNVTAKGADRMDVRELPRGLWEQARSPLLFAYRYLTPHAQLTMDVTQHKEVDVLVAISDVCEATTTVTPDGKVVTKMMYVVRNNLKQFMSLRLPQEAAIWSAFVDDRPVTPVRNAKGELLIPLKRSETGDAYDHDSYKARRDRRRSVDGETLVKRAGEDNAQGELKPYDVEIVFVAPAVKLAAQGQIALALPGSDIPCRQMAWATFVPKNLNVVNVESNCKEVAAFTLPFKHFGDVEYQRQAAAQMKMQEALAEKVDQLRAAQEMAQTAKAQGVLPVRVEIPITGQIHRLEKFLVTDEVPAATLTYRQKVE
ncbi:MAG: hypothetical protein ABFD92_17050 [Planctomycetaceae bacterium]|nr:hypothetical protein [Planctomycetaceae bacterium]